LHVSEVSEAVKRTIFLKQIKFLKMKTTKMSLATIQGKLSRAEMKKIMAGSGSSNECNCNSADDCTNSTVGKRCMNDCNGPKNGKYGVCGNI
jgi:hypothetical protein